MNLKSQRNSLGYSLIETMTVIAVIAIVIGLLYAYSDEGWKLFYQSYGRGLSQVKTKLAVKALTEDLREANKNRLTIGQGNTFGIPFPGDVKENSPFIYFTKPNTDDSSGETIGYDYILYYFAKPNIKEDPVELTRKRLTKKEDYFILKTLKFLSQSKFYTEDAAMSWPFNPPILEINKSTLPEDDSYIASLKVGTEEAQGSTETNIKTMTQEEVAQEQFLDHFSKIKKIGRNIPISGNFSARSLTDPFVKEEVNIFFGQSYKSDSPIKIKAVLEEAPLFFGFKGTKNEVEVKITPRN